MSQKFIFRLVLLHCFIFLIRAEQVFIAQEEVKKGVKNGNLLTCLSLESRSWKSSNSSGFDLWLKDNLMLGNRYKYDLKRDLSSKSWKVTKEINLNSFYQPKEKLKTNIFLRSKSEKDDANKYGGETTNNSFNSSLKFNPSTCIETNFLSSIGTSQYFYKFIDLDRNGIPDYKNNQGLDFSTTGGLQYKLAKTAIKTDYTFTQAKHQDIEKKKDKLGKSNNFKIYFEHNFPKIDLKFNTANFSKYNRYETGIGGSGEEIYKNASNKTEIILNSKHINYTLIECKKIMGKEFQKFELIQDRSYNYIDDDFSLNINTQYHWLNLNLSYNYEEDFEKYPIRLKETIRKVWQDNTKIIYNFISFSSQFLFSNLIILDHEIWKNLGFNLKTYVSEKAFLHHEEYKNGDDRELIAYDIFGIMNWSNTQNASLTISLGNNIYHKNYFYENFTKDNNRHISSNLNSSLKYPLISKFYFTLGGGLKKNFFDYIFEKKYLLENKGKNSEVSSYNFNSGLLYNFSPYELGFSYIKKEHFNNYLYAYKTHQNREEIIHGGGINFRVNQKKELFLFLPLKELNIGYSYNHLLNYGYCKVKGFYEWSNLSTDFYHSLSLDTQIGLAKNFFFNLSINSTLGSKDKVRNFSYITFSMNYDFGKNS